MSGAFNWAFTIGYGIIIKNGLHASLIGLKDANSCANIGFYGGQLVATSLETFTANYVFFKDVATFSSS